jgi:hypothetical protein
MRANVGLAYRTRWPVMVTARGNMPSRSGDHRPVTAAALVSPDFMSRYLGLHYNLRLHRILHRLHNLQFLHNRPASKSAADLQQNLASWLFRLPGRRSRPPPLWLPPRLA